MRTTLTIFAYLALTFGAYSQSDTNLFYKPRTWTTRGGKQVLAIYVSQNTDKAIIRTRDGNKLQIKKDLLDKESQSFLKRIYIVENPADEIIPPSSDISISFPVSFSNTISLVEIGGSFSLNRSNIVFPYSARWTNIDLPAGDIEHKACRDITTELKQISKALEIGISYNDFARLVQDVTLEIERIKDSSPPLPSGFIDYVDSCISCYTSARDSWHGKIFDADHLKSIREEYRITFLTLASIQFLYCQAIVQNNPDINNDILLKNALRIYTDVATYKPPLINDEASASLLKPPHPRLVKMTPDEIHSKIRSLAAQALPTEKQVPAESPDPVEQRGPGYPPQGVGSPDP
jgi:hypothetical protein